MDRAVFSVVLQDFAFRIIPRAVQYAHGMDIFSCALRLRPSQGWMARWTLPPFFPDMTNRVGICPVFVLLRRFYPFIDLFRSLHPLKNLVGIPVSPGLKIPSLYAYLAQEFGTVWSRILFSSYSSIFLEMPEPGKSRR